MNRGNRGGATSRVFHQQGYTIVEVLIFLTVSAMLFVATMFLLAGRQQKAEFVNAVRDFETKLLDIGNDVSNGYYQTNSNVQCTAVSIVPGAKGQGTNDECIFLGRFIKLGQDIPGGTDRTRFSVYSLVGKREVSPGKDVTTPLEAAPRLLLTSDATTNQSLIDQDTFSGSLEVICAAAGESCTPGNTANAAIAFVTKLNGGISANAVGGAIKADMYYYPSMQLSTPVTNMSNVTTPTPLNGRYTICLKSGGTDQYALVKIGSQNGANSTVSTEIKSYTGSTPPCN